MTNSNKDYKFKMMKKTFYLALLFLCSSISIFAQNGESVSIESFKTLTVGGRFNVTFSTGEPQLRFDNGNVNDVKVENKNGVLSIIDKREDGVLYDLVISSPELINLNLQLVGDFKVERSTIFFSTLNFNANIQGETKLNLNGEIFVGNFTNCGKINIGGTVDKIYLNLSNSGDLNTTDLKAESTSINHNN